jgi:Zn-dependent protease
VPAQFNPYTFLSQATVLLFAIIFHECAHGYVANKLGDPTARLEGRITLNPIPHIDPFGTVLLPLLTLLLPGGFFFGYAKPVPVTTTNLRNPRWDSIWVSLAGPASNFLLATLAAVALALIPPGDARSVSAFLQPLLITALFVNVYLGVFNLIPFPPLDGSWILMGLLPLNLAIRYSRLRPYGMLIIAALLWTRLINVLMWPAHLILGALGAVAAL